MARANFASRFGTVQAIPPFFVRKRTGSVDAQIMIRIATYICRPPRPPIQTQPTTDKVSFCLYTGRALINAMLIGGCAVMAN